MKSREQRFLKKVGKTPFCWLWRGSKSAGGYGRIMINYRRVRAHRLSWEIYHGDIPPGMFVCHICDNPLCVNPNHLFLGTNKDNVMDMVGKGRQNGGGPKGERHGRSVLSNSQAKKIRDLYRSGDYSYRDIAKMFGIGKTTVYQIVKRIRYDL